MKITIVGAGYVGLSIGLLLSRNHEVTFLDLDDHKVNQINNGISPIEDNEIKDFFENNKANLVATTDKESAYRNVELVVIATPTSYDEITESFDTSSVVSTIKESFFFNQNHIIIIKSTVPIGFTRKMRDKFSYNDIIFSPEFLREGSSISDNLTPSRIILGDDSKSAKIFAELLSDISTINKKNLNIIFMGPEEAESVKLFSNSYLALRVSFFNELDTYCELNNLSPESIIRGMGFDKRIGDYYNNPSFGYGGYCLPKDTKQLLFNFKDIPNAIIKAIISSNDIRKHHITEMILNKKPSVVGFYKLVMKEGSDNMRDSAVKDIINQVKIAGIETIIYEPIIKTNRYLNSEVLNDLALFKNRSNIIVTNRNSAELKDVNDKVYSRDLFNQD